jgi:hypothetical protein
MPARVSSSGSTAAAPRGPPARPPSAAARTAPRPGANSINQLWSESTDNTVTNYKSVNVSLNDVNGATKSKSRFRICQKFFPEVFGFNNVKHSIIFETVSGTKN